MIATVGCRLPESEEQAASMRGQQHNDPRWLFRARSRSTQDGRHCRQRRQGCRGQPRESEWGDRRRVDADVEERDAQPAGCAARRQGLFPTTHRSLVSGVLCVISARVADPRSCSRSCSCSKLAYQSDPVSGVLDAGCGWSMCPASQQSHRSCSPFETLSVLFSPRIIGVPKIALYATSCAQNMFPCSLPFLTFLSDVRSVGFRPRAEADGGGAEAAASLAHVRRVASHHGVLRSRPTLSLRPHAPSSLRHFLFQVDTLGYPCLA